MLCIFGWLCYRNRNRTSFVIVSFYIIIWSRTTQALAGVFQPEGAVVEETFYCKTVGGPRLEEGLV